RTLVTASFRSPVLRLWDVVTGGELQTVPFPGDSVSAVAFTPDGKALAAAGTRDGVIWLLDGATGPQTGRLPGHGGFIRFLAVLPGGKALGSKGHRALGWWGVGTGREVRRQNMELVIPLRPALSPDGKRLAAGVGPGGLHVWDAATGAEVSR